MQTLGPSSYCITIPKTFIKEHGIVAGSYVECIIDGETLHI
ncbi:MAG: AbrB/MazE/SpoVT family DNA-binding domain-containing protein [Candidatus Bathyarchaeia archaeon]